MIAAFDIAFAGAQKVETTTTNQPLAQAIIGVATGSDESNATDAIRNFLTCND